MLMMLCNVRYVLGPSTAYAWPCTLPVKQIRSNVRSNFGQPQVIGRSREKDIAVLKISEGLTQSEMGALRPVVLGSSSSLLVRYKSKCLFLQIPEYQHGYFCMSFVVYSTSLLVRHTV